MFKSTLGLALGLAVLLTAAQSGTDPGIPLVFKGVKIRFNRSATDRRLVDKTVELIFDDTGRQISVKSSERPVTIAYDDVRKVVFDVTTHMRGGALGEIICGIPGAILEAKHVNDYWFYVEQTSGSFTVLEIPKDSSAQVIDKAKALFGDRVSEYPTQQGEKIEKETLKDLQSKHSLNADKKQHPTPELKPDKALVVVVCPPLAARYSGKGNQYKLHANDKVVAVNKMGTYSFAYLDPGEYVLASQSENASALKMNLEAGKDYYFLQNTFMGAWKARTSLSLQSKEIVLHEMSGAKYADWRQK
jgi:hypothetical protein